jgi:hypothetical protein
MKKTLTTITITLLLLSIFIFYLLNRKEWFKNVDFTTKKTTKISSSQIIKNDSIQIFDILKYQVISSPLSINGQAIGSWFFEGSFPVVLYDANGKEIVSEVAMAKSNWMTEDLVPFELTLNFTVPETKEGTLVFKKDNPSGLPENDEEISIPIKFSNKTQLIKLYYYNEKEDKKINPHISCSEEFILPVERKVFLSKTPIKDTINLLLKGFISENEKQLGFSSEFPLEGFELIGANFKNGTLILEFSDPSNKTSGGSCRVNLLRQQIEKTVEQFEGVEEVKFLPETLFQP